MNLDFLKPILAQAVRDGLRVCGTWLMTYGVIKDGAGLNAFIGAGMTLAGLVWGWWITTGHVQAATLLKKLTDTKTETAAVAVAKAMPSAAATGAAVVAKSTVAAIGAQVVGALLIGFLLLAGMDHASAAQKAVSPLVPAAPAKCLLPFDPLQLCGALTGNPKDDLKRVADRIRLTSSDDIAYTIAKATAANTPASAVRLTCLNAIKVAHDQFTGIGLKKPDGTDWPRPDPALLAAIEDVAELVDELSPQGVLFTSCAGVAQMFKTDVLTAVNAVVTGATAIVAAPVGL